MQPSTARQREEREGKGKGKGKGGIGKGGFVKHVVLDTHHNKRAILVLIRVLHYPVATNISAADVISC